MAIYGGICGFSGGGGTPAPSDFGGNKLGEIRQSGSGQLSPIAQAGDYYTIANSVRPEDLPLTVDGFKVYNKKDYFLRQGGVWTLVSLLPNTQSVQVVDKTKESITGEGSTQQAINEENVSIINDIRHKAYLLTGYFSSTEPTGSIIEGLYWYQTSAHKTDGSDLPTIFPINVKEYKNGAWSATTKEYTPNNQDSWSNRNNSLGFYWFDNSWRVNNASQAEVDDETIYYNNDDQLEVKDEGITFSKINPDDVINDKADHFYYGFYNAGAELQNVFTKSITDTEEEETIDVYKITITSNIVSKIEVIGQGTIASSVLTIEESNYNRKEENDGIYISKPSEKLITLNLLDYELDKKVSKSENNNILYGRTNEEKDYDVENSFNRKNNYYYCFEAEIGGSTERVYIKNPVNESNNNVYLFGYTSGKLSSITLSEYQGLLEDNILVYNGNNYTINNTLEGFYIIDADVKIPNINALTDAIDNLPLEALEKQSINDVNKIIKIDENGIFVLKDDIAIKDVNIATATPEENTDYFYRDTTTGKIYIYRNSQFIAISGDIFEDINILPVSNISKQVLYRLKTTIYTHNGIDIENGIVGYEILDSELVSVDGTGITYNSTLTEWENVDDTYIEGLINNDLIVATTTFEEMSIIKDLDLSTYDISSNFNEKNQFTIYHNPTGNISDYVKLLDNKTDISNNNKIYQVNSTGKIELSDFKVIKDVDIETATPDENTDILYKDTNTEKLYFYRSGEFIAISSDVFQDVETLPTTDISKAIIYRLAEYKYYYNHVEIPQPTGLKTLNSEVLEVTSSGLNYTEEEGGETITTAWDDVTDSLISDYISSDLLETTFVFEEADFYQVDLDTYVYKQDVIKETEYTLYHNPAEESGEYIKIGGDDILVDDTTIKLNSSGKLAVKDGNSTTDGIKFNHLNTTIYNNTIANENNKIPLNEAVWKELLDNSQCKFEYNTTTKQIDLKLVNKNNDIIFEANINCEDLATQNSTKLITSHGVWRELINTTLNKLEIVNNVLTLEFKNNDNDTLFTKTLNIDATATQNSTNLIDSNGVWKEELNNTNSTFEYDCSNSAKDVINIELQNNNADAKIDKTIDFNDKITFKTNTQTLLNKTLDFDTTSATKNIATNIPLNALANQTIANQNKILQVSSTGDINISDFNIIKDVDITTATPSANTDILYRDTNTGGLYCYRNNAFVDLLALKQDKLTNGAEIISPIPIDELSGVNLTTKKVHKISFLNLLSWIKDNIFSWCDTTITYEATDTSLPTSHAVYKLYNTSRKYLHTMVRYNNESFEYTMGWWSIINDQETMTFENMRDWLNTNGYTSASKCYYWCGGCCGTTGVRNKEDTGTAYVGKPTSGVFYDGANMFFKADYNATVQILKAKTKIYSTSLYK